MAYGEKIRNAFSFARHSGAVWWYAGYAVALGAVTIVLLLALLFGAGVKSVASLFADSGRLALAALFALAWIGFAVFAGNGVNGAVIQNTVQAGPMRQSWEKFRPRFWSLFGASILVAVVSGLVSFVFSGLAQASGPLQTVLVGLNLAVSIALALAFLFVEYAVVIRNRDALDGIGQSVHLFREKPAEVAVAFLVSLLAALGLYLAAFVVLAVLALIVAGAAGFSMPTLLSWAVPLLAVVAPLLLLAHFFIQAFQHHLLAHLFLDLTAAPKTAPVLRRAPARKAKAPAHKKARRSGK